MATNRATGRYRTEQAVSAGGVVYRRTGSAVEVVICGRTSDSTWGLPKGTPEEGESLEQTAVREVSEETGLQVDVERKVTTIDYWFVVPGGRRIHKWVHHYLLRPTGGDTDAHDAEYDLVAWVPADEAVSRLTYDNEANVVRKALALVQGEAA